jgi:hypothetical protein
MAATTSWFLLALFFPLIFAQVKIMPLGDSTTAIVSLFQTNYIIFQQLFVIDVLEGPTCAVA